MEPLERASPEFCSPEIASCLPVSCASDIFSIGTVLYMILTGFSPFLGNTDKNTLVRVKQNKWEPWESSSKIHPALRSLIESCFQPDPETRLTIEEISKKIKTIKLSSSKVIDGKRVKYLFLRHRYQSKQVSSNSSNEPRRIYDILYMNDSNESWMTKRISTTLLSDSSETEEDNEGENNNFFVYPKYVRYFN